MIYCPNCGTANWSGSRFCNECGEDLGPETHIECPRCETLNLAQNVLCSHCGARLPTAVSPPEDAETAPTIKGLSLPTKSPAGEQGEASDTGSEPDDEIPAWLHELGASLPDKDTEGASDSAEDSGEVPDWLRDLRASIPEDKEEPLKDKQAVPEWLTEPEPDSTETPVASTSDEYDPEPDPEEPVPTGEPAAEAHPPKAEAKTQDEIPGWLSRLVPTAADEKREAEPPTPDKEEPPGWLTRLVPADKEAEAGTAEVEDDRRERQPEPVEEETLAQPEEIQPTPVSEGKEDELPEWLTNLQEPEEEAESEEAAPVLEIEEGEIPDWMADLRPTEDEEGEPATPEIEIEEGEIPDWMADLRPTEDEEGEPAPPEIEEGELPDWVAALKPVEEEAEDELPLPTIDIVDEEEFPDRVEELEPPTEEIPLAEALESPDGEEVAEDRRLPKLPDEVEAALGAVPGWLAELQVEDPDAAAAIIEETMVDGELPEWLVRSEIEPDEGLAPAEIPRWLLALKPTELREEGEEIEIPPSAPGAGVEETGLLAGIPGVLPVEMLIAQPRAISAAESPDLAIEDSPEAKLFANVVGRPPEAAPKEIESPRAYVLPEIARWIIYGLLILVVALPIIMGEPLLERTIESTAATVAMSDTIGSLESGDPVLVAFDYDPTTRGEMDVIARALIGHLMDQEANVVIVSLLPAGPATAESLLQELSADRPGYADGYGERYANLGYLPGQAAAVRLLGLSVPTSLPRDFYGTRLSDLPVMQGLDSAQDFSLIIELAATQDTLRWWIEQAGTPYSIPLATGASAAVIPYARPYYETEARQLVGIVGGVPDAVTYEALTSDQNIPTNSTAARLDSQLAGQLLFILVLLAGNVVYLTRRGSRSER